MTEHDILERLWAGEVDLDAPEVQAAAERDPEVRAEVERLRATATYLHALGRRRKDVIAEAATLSRVPGETVVANVVRQQRRSPGRWPWLLLAAAAIVVGCALLWRAWTPTPRPNDGQLGSTTMTPSGTVADYGVFQWSYGGAGCEYVVTVFDGNGQRLDGSGRIRAQRWTPTAVLPAEIEWRLEVKTPDPDNDASYRARARLRD